MGTQQKSSEAGMNQIDKLKCLNCKKEIRNHLGLYAECKKCKSLFEINWVDDTKQEDSRC